MGCTEKIHEASDLTRDSGLIRCHILLNAETGKEGEDHVGEQWRVRGAGQLGLDVANNKSFQGSVVLVDDVLCIAWEKGDIAQRVDGEATAAAAVDVASLSDGKEAFDVVPTPGLGDEDVVSAARFKVVTQALKEDVLLIFEFGVEAGFVDSGCALEVLHRGLGEAFLPEDADGLREYVFAREELRSSHDYVMLACWFATRNDVGCEPVLPEDGHGLLRHFPRLKALRASDRHIIR